MESIVRLRKSPFSSKEFSHYPAPPTIPSWRTRLMVTPPAVERFSRCQHKALHITLRLLTPSMTSLSPHTSLFHPAPQPVWRCSIPPPSVRCAPFISRLALLGWYCHVLRREDSHVFRRPLYFDVEDQRKKWRPKRTLEEAVWGRKCED